MELRAYWNGFPMPSPLIFSMVATPIDGLLLAAFAIWLSRRESAKRG